jgi:hypothetical protein
MTTFDHGCFCLFIDRVVESVVGGGAMLVDACKVKLYFVTVLFHCDHLHSYDTLTHLE